MRVSRTDRSLVAEWWFTVDRVLLTAFFVLIGMGAVLSLAAGPAVAIKKGLPTFYFVERHLLVAVAGTMLMLGLSLLSPRQIRRLALVVLLASLGMMVAVFMSGPEINGARRWLRMGGHSFQPSEIGKPAFVVLSAWLLAESSRRADVPAFSAGGALYVVVCQSCRAAADVGQALLISAVWGSLFFLSGQPLSRIMFFGLLGTSAFAGAYATFPHVRGRILRFFDPSSGDTYQTDRAIESFTEGGFFGRGPGEGVIKTILPDAHTDFPFAVIGEEFGTLACLVIVGLFAFVVFRALWHAWRDPNAFTRLSIAGLALLFGLQALINMAVNVGLVPAKGMTLPFISAGGSAYLAVSLLAGMLLSLTRRRADAGRVKKPSFRTTTAGMELGGADSR
ncbi:MAG: cell division protein FtsW [Sphingomonadales bacterium]|nr:cell division protein FtsW [Sphingomonadales bacterium]